MRKIRYQYPERAIFYDEDGSLTGVSKSWATPDWEHNRQPECYWGEMEDQNGEMINHADVYDGIICGPEV
jgi:hypothetical protein